MSSSDTENDSQLITTNSGTFKDCLTPVIYRKLTTNNKYGEPEIPIEELAEFIDYLSEEIFPTLPLQLQQLTYPGKDKEKELSYETVSPAHQYPIQAMPLSFSDSLTSYGIVNDEDDAQKLLLSVLEDYVSEARKPPPVWKMTKKEECEICERVVPLTYHHLIPKSTHAKVLKRGWHPEHMLNSVAWICRPCHNMCHRVADTETLAKHYYTLEKLMEREDMQKWAAYQSKRRYDGPRPK